MVCTICGYVLSAARFQCEDGSGWMYGWLCDCTLQEREKYTGSEIIIHSNAYQKDAVDYMLNEIKKHNKED